jgi:hypothetical protein
MKDLDYYLSLPYRLEIIPDTDEGAMALPTRSCRGV